MKQNVDDIKLKEAKALLESHGFECCDFDAFIASLGIECIEVIPPINSTVCCVKRADKQWAAFELGNKTPVVDFGKYNYMWGFDNGYCLVSVADKDRTTFANRGIIDSHGNEVVKPYTYTNIWKFYGEDRPEIVAFTEDSIVGLDRNNPEVVIKNKTKTWIFYNPDTGKFEECQNNNFDNTVLVTDFAYKG